MTLYFYDLETSGFNPKTARIMQFAGQRTDLKLNPLGEPDNFLVKMTPDVLPEPDAVLVTGITPQKTLSEGISEAELIDYLVDKVFVPDTVMVGYNNIRFDDEFMRFMLWRNFADAYQWQWKDGCSRWDLLDVVRMTRALRPDGIKWPFAPDGKPTVRLEFMSSLNKLKHTDAHDALSDVKAALALARLVKQNQPHLYGYLFNLRDKRKTAALVEKGEPVIYTSGRYPSEFEKTTVAVIAAATADGRGALMYDLRIDPAEILQLSSAQLAQRLEARRDEAPYFPVKKLSYNRCPVIAPLSVLDKPSAKRLGLDHDALSANLKRLRSSKDFSKRLIEAFDSREAKRQTEMIYDQQSVDGRLYDKFVGDSDRLKMRVLRESKAKLGKLNLNFDDERLNLLLPLYKARNFPETLTEQEKNAWEDFRRRKLASGEPSLAGRFFGRLNELRNTPDLGSSKQALLKDLESYARSVVPSA